MHTFKDVIRHRLATVDSFQLIVRPNSIWVYTQLFDHIERIPPTNIENIDFDVDSESDRWPIVKTKTIIQIEFRKRFG